MKPLHLAAILATLLVVVTGVNSALRPAPRHDRPPRPKPTRVSDTRCTIERAAFGGTEAAVLKVLKDRTAHYVVLDLPADNPRMPDIASRWLAATYGTAEASLVGVFPTVEDALTKAGGLCRTN
jgi:hypothetical protein